MWLAWLLMVGVLLLAVSWWFGAEQTSLRNRWLDEMYGAQNGTLGVGISLLVTEVRSEESYIELLGCEYAALEVVALLDGGLYPDLMQRLMTRYHLMRVEYHPSGEFPVRGVWGLYRSRKRRFRRLVVIDCRSSSRANRLSVAADVAGLEYLLPLARDERLRRRSLERLATEVALHPLLSIDQVCLLPPLRPILWRRVALAAGGGFEMRPFCLSERRRRIRLWLSPLKRERRFRKAFWWAILWYLAWILPPLVWGLQGAFGAAWMWFSMGLLVALCRLRIRQLDRAQ